MFDVGFSELVLIAVLALIVLGPKRLPEVARTAGQWLGRLRRFMADVKQDFDRELNSAELAELRQLKQELHDTRRQIEESSSQLYNTIAKESAPDSVAPVAPPPEAVANRDAPVRPPAARRKRARRTPSDGGTGKA